MYVHLRLIPLDISYGANLLLKNILSLCKSENVLISPSFFLEHYYQIKNSQLNNFLFQNIENAILLPSETMWYDEKSLLFFWRSLLHLLYCCFVFLFEQFMNLFEFILYGLLKFVIFHQLWAVLSIISFFFNFL